MLIACCNLVKFALHDDLVVDVGSRPVPRHSHEPWNSEGSAVYFGPRSIESTLVHDVFSILTNSFHSALINRGVSLHY